MDWQTVDDQQHKYSVVIPLYNKQDSIARAIHSVLQQKGQTFELIVVDDGSSDDSVSRVREIHDERIRLVEQANSGASAARNRGIHLAKYPYIAFLDADDQWLPDFLTLISGLIMRFPAAGAYATNYWIENLGQMSREAKMKYVPLEVNGGLIGSYYRSIAYGNSPISSSSVCIPRSVFDRAGFFPEGVRLYEDLDMWTRIAAQFPIAYNNHPGAIYQRDAQNRACDRIVPNRNDLKFAESLRIGMQRGDVYGDDVKYAIEFINRYALQNAFKAVVAGDSHEGRFILSAVRPQSFGKFWRKILIYLYSFLPGFAVNTFWEIGKRLKADLR